MSCETPRKNPQALIAHGGRGNTQRKRKGDESVKPVKNRGSGSCGEGNNSICLPNESMVANGSQSALCRGHGYSAICRPCIDVRRQCYKGSGHIPADERSRRLRSRKKAKAIAAKQYGKSLNSSDDGNVNTFADTVKAPSLCQYTGGDSRVGDRDSTRYFVHSLNHMQDCRPTSG